MRRAVLVAAMIGWALVGLGPSAGAEAMDDSLWVYDPKGRCDPFVPLVREGRPVPCDTRPGAQADGTRAATPVLGGILWDPDGHSIALINGGEAKVGDTIDGFRVAAIRKDEVVLTRQTERVVLRISFEPQSPESGAGRKKEVGGP